LDAHREVGRLFPRIEKQAVRFHPFLVINIPGARGEIHGLFFMVNLTPALSLVRRGVCGGIFEAEKDMGYGENRL